MNTCSFCLSPPPGKQSCNKLFQIAALSSRAPCHLRPLLGQRPESPTHAFVPRVLQLPRCLVCTGRAESCFRGFEQFSSLGRCKRAARSVCLSSWLHYAFQGQSYRNLLMPHTACRHHVEWTFLELVLSSQHPPDTLRWNILSSWAAV